VLAFSFSDTRDLNTFQRSIKIVIGDHQKIVYMVIHPDRFNATNWSYLFFFKLPFISAFKCKAMIVLINHFFLAEHCLHLNKSILKAVTGNSRIANRLSLCNTNTGAKNLVFTI